MRQGRRLHDNRRPQSKDKGWHGLRRLHAIGEHRSATFQSSCSTHSIQVTSIFNAEMRKAGHKINNNLCPHFAISRADLFAVVRVKKLRDFTEIMRDSGVDKDSLGCEICKPAIGSILSSL
jgi:nitrite reductase (NAD(P)H)